MGLRGQWPVPYAGLKAPKPPPDWRGLLKLYMTFVLRKQGVTYVASLLTYDTLTDAERAAISDICAEVKKENPDA